MKRSKITLKWKLFLLLSGFIVLVLGFIWLFQMVFLEDFYRAAKINGVKEAADTLGKNIDNENLDILVDRFAFFEEITVRIVNRDGEIVHKADAKYGTLASLSDATLMSKYEEASAKGGTYLYTGNYKDFMPGIDDNYNFEGKIPGTNAGDATSIIYIKLVDNSDGDNFAVMVNSTITPINAAKNTTLIQLTVISVGVLILTFIIAFVLAKSVVSPIESLTVAAKGLSKGRSDGNFNIKGYKEIEDLSDTLKFAGKELSEVEHLRKELIANVSHDLRTPLTLIKGYTEMMRDMPAERTSENLLVISEETERLSNLVNDILDLSKIRDGEKMPELKVFDITASAASVTDRLSAMLKGQGYKLIFSASERPLYVRADESQIMQVLYNLITNAVNYAGEDKVIEITVTKKNAKVRVDIIDHGEGIDVEHVPHIWERYYKTEKSHKRAIAGTGLGLSIVKSVMIKHPGGVYGVETAKNKGSKFYIELPNIIVAHSPAEQTNGKA